MLLLHLIHQTFRQIFKLMNLTFLFCLQTFLGLTVTNIMATIKKKYIPRMKNPFLNYATVNDKRKNMMKGISNLGI